MPFCVTFTDFECYLRIFLRIISLFNFIATLICIVTTYVKSQTLQIRSSVVNASKT